jgi:hypothetical protein
MNLQAGKAGVGGGGAACNGVPSRPGIISALANLGQVSKQL